MLSSPLTGAAAEDRAAALDRIKAEGQKRRTPSRRSDRDKGYIRDSGLRTTWGSKSIEDHVPDKDALHVTRLRAAGAVIIGKTNTPEFAFGGQTSNLVAGTTCNPLSSTKTVAGSSGGSAAALAAQMVALADGSDLGGSLRTPAAWCGIVGYRPSVGLIPYASKSSMFDGIHTPGPMARNLRDTSLMLQVMQGNTPQTPLEFGQEMPAQDTLNFPNARPGRVSLSLAPFGAAVDPSVQAAIAPVEHLCRDLDWQVEQDAPEPGTTSATYRRVEGVSCAAGIEGFLSGYAHFNWQIRQCLRPGRRIQS